MVLEALEQLDRSGLALDAKMTQALLGEEKAVQILPTATKVGKRSLLADGHGLHQSVVIAGAHRHNIMLLEETLAGIVIDLPATVARWQRPV